VHHQLGLLHWSLGDAANAVDQMRKAVQVSPEDAIAHNNLGNMLVDSGQPELAVPHYRQAIRIDRTYASAHFNLAKAYQHTGQSANAVAQFQIAANLLPGEPQILSSWGAALLEDGSSGEALAKCLEAVERGPGLAETHNNLGLVELALGDFASAASRFRRALDLDPYYGPAAANLTRTRRFDSIEDEDVRRVERLFDVPELDEQVEIDVRFALGKIHDDTGHYAQAFAHYRRANELKQRHSTFVPGDYLDEIAARALVFNREFFAARADYGNSSDVPVFIVGMPRSGTSLVEQVIASHPQVFGAGELPDISLCRDRLAQGRPGNDWVRDLDAAQITEVAELYLERLLTRSGDRYRRVADKMPANFLDLGLISLMFPRARVINCQRDRRDCGLSIYFRNFTSGHDYAYDLANIAVYQRGYEQLLGHWHTAGLPLQILDVSYESLVSDMEAQARRLIQFCGVNWDPACLEFYRSERAVYTASTWQVRQPVYSHAVGRWKPYAAHLHALGG
jgi:Tfp pilus assembly protein PilF